MAEPTTPAKYTAPPIFLDRDGTLIEEVHFLSSLHQMHLVPGAAEAVRAANVAGHPLIVVTNQSGVARGYITEDFVRESAAHLRELLGEKGATLAGHYYCPFHPDGRPPFDGEHPDRKPGDGMLLRAARELGMELAGSWMIGDRQSDLDTGAERGVRPILVRTGYGKATEERLNDHFFQRGGQVFDTIVEALGWILAKTSRGEKEKGPLNA